MAEHSLPKEAPPNKTPASAPLSGLARIAAAGRARRAARREARAARRGGGSSGGAASAGGSGGGSGNANPVPLGDRVPQPLDVATGSTGITGPGAEGPQSQAELGQGVVDATEQSERDQFTGELEDQERADELATDVEADKEATLAGIDTVSGEARADRKDLEADIAGTKEELGAIPEQITQEFDRLREQFAGTADASFDRIDSQRSEALGKADFGRSAAMEAAVQGIQGNVNTSIAQIQGNPNLTEGQKQNMISQVRLSGAASMGPAIGQTVLAFNQLSADIATKFGAITGNLEGTILGVKGQLSGLQGQAFSQAQVAVGQMTNQLLEINSNSAASYANSQGQLLATRSQASMSGNNTLLQLLPEQSTPYLDVTGSATAAYAVGTDLAGKDFANRSQSFGMELLIHALREDQGTPLGNIVRGILGGARDGGRAGAAFGLFGAIADNQGARI